MSTDLEVYTGSSEEEAEPKVVWRLPLRSIVERFRCWAIRKLGGYTELPVQVPKYVDARAQADLIYQDADGWLHATKARLLVLGPWEPRDHIPKNAMRKLTRIAGSKGVLSSGRTLTLMMSRVPSMQTLQTCIELAPLEINARVRRAQEGEHHLAPFGMLELRW